MRLLRYFDERILVRPPLLRETDAPLRHHLHKIAEAELEPQIPADAKNDDLAIEMAALE